MPLLYALRRPAEPLRRPGTKARFTHTQRGWGSEASAAGATCTGEEQVAGGVAEAEAEDKAEDGGGGEGVGEGRRPRLTTSTVQ